MSSVSSRVRGSWLVGRPSFSYYHTVFVIFGSLVLFCQPAFSQDARQILRATGAAYSNLRTFHFEGSTQMTVEIDGIKYRMNVPTELAQGESPGESLTVKFAIPTWEKSGDVSRADPPFPHMPRALSYDFLTLGQRVKLAKLLQQQTLQANGKSRPCFVIEVVRASDVGVVTTQTVWIDKTTRLVLRVEFQTSAPRENSQPGRQLNWITTFSAYKLNGDPPEWLVKLKSSREKQVEDLRSTKIGTPAPDFTLQDLNGREVSLRNYVGRIVLLDFWATWCLPCREELPLISKIERNEFHSPLVLLFARHRR